jgi:hypothetical protein
VRDPSEGETVIKIAADEFDLVMGHPLDFVFVLDWGLFLVEFDNCILLQF